MIHYQDRWAVVTGASSGFGRVFATRLANKGMSLVLTGRDEGGLEDTADQIRSEASTEVEIVAVDLSSSSGVGALIAHVGDRPIEVLINNAGFGTFGPFDEADGGREDDELAVDVNAVVTLARAFQPGMIARGSGGILNVASTIAFQPAPYQAVYGASKAFVLSFSQALWAESRTAGVAVTALCPGPTRTGFVDGLGGDAGDTAIYRRLADPEPVVDAGLRALDRGRAVVTPGVRNKLLAFSGRLTPREILTLLSGRLLRPGARRRRRARVLQLPEPRVRTAGGRVMALTMRGTATMTVDVPAEDLDLDRWLFGLSDADYQACARGHQGAGVYTDEHGRGMVNVESIGGNLIVQHYRPVHAGSAAMEMYSAASRVYLLHLVPVPASVRWLLAVEPTSDSSSALTCTVHVTLHPVLRLLGGLMAAGTFLQRHVDEEIAGFVADITRKYLAARQSELPASLRGTNP